jgi:hypothetical protein
MFPMSRTTLTGSVNVRLSQRDLAALDAMRGRSTRATALRGLLRAEVVRRKQAQGPRTPPTHAESLRLLALHAELDAGAAIELERSLRTQAEVDALNALMDAD